MMIVKFLVSDFVLQKEKQLKKVDKIMLNVILVCD